MLGNLTLKWGKFVSLSYVQVCDGIPYKRKYTYFDYCTESVLRVEIVRWVLIIRKLLSHVPKILGNWLCKTQKSIRGEIKLTKHKMKPYGDELAQIVSNDKNKGWKEAWNAI